MSPPRPLTVVSPTSSSWQPTPSPSRSSYIYVPKQADLGRACGVSRNIVAVSIIRNPDSSIFNKIQEVKDKVE